MENIANPFSRIRFRHLPRIGRALFLGPIRYPQIRVLLPRIAATPWQCVETAQISRKSALFRNAASPKPIHY